MIGKWGFSLLPFYLGIIPIFANNNYTLTFDKIRVVIHILGGVIHVFLYHSVVGYVLAYGTSATTHSVIHI